MTDEKESGVDFSFLRLSPAEALAARLSAGEHIRKPEIAKFLLANPPDGWPANLTEHVVGLLEGKIKGPKGRPQIRNAAIRKNLIQIFYPVILRVLQGDLNDVPGGFDEAVDILGNELDDTLAPHERAKSITSMLVFGSTGHEKTVQELYRSK